MIIVLGFVMQDRLDMSATALTVVIVVALLAYWMVAWLCVGVINRYLTASS